MRAKLPYCANVAELFEQIKDWPSAVWLDSGYPSGNGGRYDILAADPYCKISYRWPNTQIQWRQGGLERLEAEPLDVIKHLMGPQQQVVSDLPFSGGCIGYLGYELGRQFMGLPVSGSVEVPTLIAGLYDWVVVVDHHAQRSWLTSHHYHQETEAQWQSLLDLFTHKPHKSSAKTMIIGAISHGISEQQYAMQFEKIQSYIYEGDCYQVNYAQPFSASFNGDAWDLYQQQRGINPAPYSAYLNFDEVQILSASPEQFLSLDEGLVTTRPIKGTVARQETRQADERVKKELSESSKDRAENLMIVDLLRNDLGRVCQPGSIKVKELFSIESFATVHHLVSTIEGKLADHQDALSLLKACFPGGSITGAPKHRAMQIIDELEQQSRGIYCGSVFWLGFNGNMDSNILIRTMRIENAKVEYWAGGGIVADSQATGEYQESLDKAAAFFQLQGEPLQLG